MDVSFRDFIWDSEKELANIGKHGIDFATASLAFLDTHRRTFKDSKHSVAEPRFFCIGRVDGKVMTVRYMIRQGKIRIIGAGYWRRGAALYEKKG